MSIRMRYLSVLSGLSVNEIFSAIRIPIARVLEVKIGAD